MDSRRSRVGECLVAVTKHYKPKREPMIRDFWPRYIKHAILITISVQIIISAGIITGMLLNNVITSLTPLLILSIALLTATILGNVILVTNILGPLRDLAAVLTHISGESNKIHPPNPNAPSYQFDGFSRLLQEVYELALSRDNSGGNSKATDASVSVLLESAFEHSSASVIITNEDGEVLYASPSAPVKTDSNGVTQIDLIFEDDMNFAVWLADSRERLVHSNTTWLRVADKIVGENNRRIFDISASYEKGNKAPVVLVLFNHSEQYQPEDDQLDFISFAAHELRGPITVIRGYSDVLAQELPHTPENYEALALIERLSVSANRLSGYINNILNASRFDRRHMQLHLSEQSLASIYLSIADDMLGRARTQNRSLNVNIPSDLPTVAADPSSMSEVLGNLIDNAIKYSNDGGTVEVKAYTEGDFVRTDVIDSGIGMPNNVVGNLFHKFYRSHRSRETVAGTGIGLYISKAVVESHGGSIEVKSEEGKGSTFSVLIPIYSTVAEKLASSDNSNSNLIKKDKGGWIENHSKFRS